MTSAPPPGGTAGAARWLFLARRNLRNILVRYRRLPPARLLRDKIRAQRLRWRDPPPRPAIPHAERVVVSLTSIPGRVERIAPVIRGLRDQTVRADRIVLNWQTAPLRDGSPCPPPPALPAGVELAVCEGSGPSLKLLPTLRAEPNAVIVVVDDDVIYPPDFLETLLNWHRADPRAALGYRGWIIQPERGPRDFDHVFATALDRPMDVDILFGTWGYLVPPGAADDAFHDFEGWPPAMRWVDDVWISGHLKRRGVPRRVVPAQGLPIETGASAIASLSEGLNRSGENDSTAIAAFAPWR